jgi:hypothetical protein
MTDLSKKGYVLRLLNSNLVKGLKKPAIDRLVFDRYDNSIVHVLLSYNTGLFFREGKDLTFIVKKDGRKAWKLIDSKIVESIRVWLDSHQTSRVKNF